MIAPVQVFWSRWMRSRRAGVIRAATPEELRLSTGYDRMDYRIPADVIEAVGGGRPRSTSTGGRSLRPSFSSVAFSSLDVLGLAAFFGS